MTSLFLPTSNGANNMLQGCIRTTFLVNKAASPTPCMRVTPSEQDDKLVPALPDLPEQFRKLLESGKPLTTLSESRA
jgi:hypothetical protein